MTKIGFGERDKPTTASGDKINAGLVQLPIINLFGYEGKMPGQEICEVLDVTNKTTI